MSKQRDPSYNLRERLAVDLHCRVCRFQFTTEQPPWQTRSEISMQKPQANDGLHTRSSACIGSFDIERCRTSLKSTNTEEPGDPRFGRSRREHLASRFVDADTSETSLLARHFWAKVSNRSGVREMAWSLHETTELNVHWLTSSESSSRCLPLDPQTESCQ